MSKIKQIYLYRPHTDVVDTAEIASWLEDVLDVDVEVKSRFLDVYGGDEVAEGFAESRVHSPYKKKTGSKMLGVIRYEERVLENPEKEGGVLYDGLQVQRSLYPQIPEDERGSDFLHLVLLDRALATWGDHDGRWHKRVNVLGSPSVVSVPGLYEAPAKPEEYYKKKQKYSMMSGSAPPREILENEIEGDFMVKDDPRTTEALKGYVLQAVEYRMTGEAFCENEGCRLHNAHRQSEVVENQLQEPEFCDDHRVSYLG
ncbi:MAG: DUF6775 family putative metallopeptidase [Halobacteria archaeon]